MSFASAKPLVLRLTKTFFVSKSDDSEAPSVFSSIIPLLSLVHRSGSEQGLWSLTAVDSVVSDWLRAIQTKGCESRTLEEIIYCGRSRVSLFRP